MSIKNASKRPPLPVPTSSMGDIAFLLIIFFMLTSKFMQESHIKYEQAKSPDIKEIEDTNISVVVDENDVIWLQGEEVSSVEDLKSRVESLKSDDKATIVMLKIHKNSLHKTYGDLILKLSEAGVKISFIGDKSIDYNN